MAVLAAAGCDTPEERARAHFERGLHLVETGVDEKAALEFRNALRLDRGLVAANLQLGLLQERQGNVRAAAGQFRTVVEAEPENGVARLKLGQIMMLSGQFDAAREHVAEAARLLPGNAEAHSAYAALLARLGDAVAARAEAEAALAIDPEHAPAHIVLIAAEAEAGDLAGALAMLDTRLAATPREYAYAIIRLQLLQRMGDVAGVGAQLERMAADFPEETAVRQALAEWRIAQGDVAGAESDMRALADAQGREGLVRLVGFLVSQRGVDAGRAELEARIAADPDKSSELRRMLADLEIGAGRVAEGKAILRELIAEGGDAIDLNTSRIRLAFAELADGDRDAALALVEDVLAVDAENSEALAARGAVAIEQMRLADAIADLRAALRGDPENARYMLLLATAHERQGDVAATTERFASAARASDFAPDIAIRYARFLLGRGELSGAEAALSESARRNPRNRQVLGALAEVQLRRSDWVGAERTAAALAALSGGETAARQVTAVALGAQGRVEESVRMLEEAVAANSQSAAAITRLVSAYVATGEIDRAVALVDRLRAERPDDVVPLLLRAELHVLQDEPDVAEALLRDLVAARPEEPAGYLALARFLIAAGRVDESARAVDEGRARLSENVNLLAFAAALKERQGDFPGAIEIYRTLHALAPDSVVHANNLASLIADHQSDDPGALAFAAQVALRLRSYDVPEFKDTYGWILFLQGDTAGAIGPLREAAGALPNNAIVRYHVARAYAALGQTAEARSHFEAALAIDPAFPLAASAREALAALAAAPQ